LQLTHILFVSWKVAIFHNRVVTVILVQSFLFGAVYQAYLYYLPLYLQNVLQLSVLDSAAYISAMVVAQSLVSVLSGQYLSRMKRYSEVIASGFGLWTL
jgi:hypothetical protein